MQKLADVMLQHVMWVQKWEDGVIKCLNFVVVMPNSAFDDSITSQLRYDDIIHAPRAEGAEENVPHFFLRSSADLPPPEMEGGLTPPSN